MRFEARFAVVFGTIALLSFCIADEARGDELHLKSGGVMRGEVTRVAEGYRVRLASGAEVTFPADQVDRVVERESARDRYRVRLAALERHDAEGHYRLGLASLAEGLTKEARLRFEHAILVQPAHVGARTQLGYVFWEGRWMLEAQALRARGLVRYRDRWVEADEFARLTYRDDVKRARGELRRSVKRLRFNRPGTALFETAFRQVAASDGDAAREPLLDLAAHHDASVRRAVATALRHYAGDRDAEFALVRAASTDRSLAVQDAAVESIRLGRMRQACVSLLDAYMRSPESSVRNAAANALGKARFKPAVPALLSTLVMVKRQTNAVPVRLGPEVRRLGGGYISRRYRLGSYGLGAATRYEIRNDYVFNDAARVALRELAEGVDHDYDVSGWSQYWRETWDHTDDFMRARTPPTTHEPEGSERDAGVSPAEPHSPEERRSDPAPRDRSGASSGGEASK